MVNPKRLLIFFVLFLVFTPAMEGASLAGEKKNSAQVIEMDKKWSKKNARAAKLFHNKEYDKALKEYTKLLKYLKKNNLLNSPEEATTLNNLGFAYMLSGDFENADKHMQRALELRQQIFGLTHPECANTLSNLAHLYQSQARVFQAQAQFIIDHNKKNEAQPKSSDTP